MKHIQKIAASLILILTLASCSKEDIIGVRTVIKGHVSDNIRGKNIGGYKVVLSKSWSSCETFKCGVKSVEVATAHTDENGDYSITFNYKLKEGESYGLVEQYYGSPYYSEYIGRTEIVAGKTNIVDINAWKPIELKLNAEVLDNKNKPLMVRNEIDDSNRAFLNVENINEENITKTINLRSKPNTDIKIIFWYYTGPYSSQTLHQKTFLYHTTLDDVTTLSYTIDCSTF